jgi:hypothetical protein
MTTDFHYQIDYWIYVINDCNLFLVPKKLVINNY